MERTSGEGVQFEIKLNPSHECVIMQLKIDGSDEWISCKVNYLSKRPDVIVMDLDEIKYPIKYFLRQHLTAYEVYKYKSDYITKIVFTLDSQSILSKMSNVNKYPSEYSIGKMIPLHLYDRRG